MSSSAPGAIRRPRKSSSSAGRVHEFGMSQLWVFPGDAITSWLTADAQSDHQMMCAGAGPLTLFWFHQHLIWLPPRRILLSECLFWFEGDLILHHVVGRSCKLVCHRPDGDDPIGL